MLGWPVEQERSSGFESRLGLEPSRTSKLHYNTFMFNNIEVQNDRLVIEIMMSYQSFTKSDRGFLFWRQAGEKSLFARYLR